MASVSVARRFVGDVLSEAAADVEMAEDAVLLTSEMVTNSLLHAKTACRVTVDIDRRLVRVEVHDDVHQVPQRRMATTADESGRGLELVEALALRWGSRIVEGDGKVVWFEFGR